MTAHEKGNALEGVVCAIESTILGSSPSLRGRPFRIESKKIVVVEGVRHEFDVWVEVDVAPGYKSLFIFECKNWEDKVGKNEIIVFSEKIRAVQAQRGYFVAKSFTRDAEAQARSLKDPRQTLLTANEHEPLSGPVPFDCHWCITEFHDISVMLRPKALKGKPSKTVPVDPEAIAEFLGQKGPFINLVRSWARWLSNERLRSFESHRQSEGTYDFEAETDLDFPPDLSVNGQMIDLSVNGQAIARAKLHVCFSVRVVRPAILVHFEVGERGRYYGFEPVETPDGKLYTMFVQCADVPPTGAGVISITGPHRE